MILCCLLILHLPVLPLVPVLPPPGPPIVALLRT